MKIAFLIQSMQRGGIQRVVLDQTLELERRGHEVHLITLNPEPTGDSLMPSLSLSTIQRHYVPYPRMRSITGMRRLICVLKDVDPDICITHHWFANTVGRIAARSSGIRTVLSFEHSVYDTHKPRRQFVFDWFLQDWCRFVIAVSESVRTSLVHNGIRSHRIRILPNGIDLSRFTRRELPKDTVRLLCIGRLIGDKGIDVLIDALQTLSSITLRIVGTGPEQAVLERKTRDRGLSKRITFLGSRDDIPELLAEAEVLVLPSRREGFGLVAVEAFASGVPVVASDLPALREIVRDGVNGLLVPPSDSRLLRDALERITKDSELRMRLAAHTGDDIARFSIQVHTDTLLTLCKN